MVNISIVSVHCVKNDAISNVMKTYSDWIRVEPGYAVKCYGYHTEYTQEELPFHKVEQEANLLLDPHFQNSHVVIFQYGIYYPLMDLVSLAPVHAKVLGIFHNVTPKEFVAPQHHALIDKSFAQIQNLRLVDYVVCDSPTNLKELRAHGVQTPAAVFPLWFKKMYGTPCNKPSFYDRIIRIAFIGRFVRSKGPLDLLSALHLYLGRNVSQINKQSGLQLTIMCNRVHSESALLEDAQNRALVMQRDFGEKLKIKFLFNIPDDQKFQELQSADIFVLPTYHEGFCVPVIEAMSSGCRIVSYNNSNIPFVAGEGAHLAQTGNIESLAEEITKAVGKVTSPHWWQDGSESYSAFVEKNTTHLAEFSPAKARQRLHGLFEALLKTSMLQLSTDGLVEPKQATLAMLEAPQIRRPLGINVLGFISGLLGLGEAARAMVYGLSSADHISQTIPYQLTDFRVPQLASLVETSFTDFSDDYKYAFNLSMLNPPELEGAMSQYGHERFKGRFNIGLWYWELVDIIPEWAPAFKCIDELWVTTNYIRDNMLQCSSVPVHKVTIPILIDFQKVRSSREEFQLPKDVFLFVFAFDQNSVMARKNPIAVIDAYRKAFGNRKDVGLVIKTINGDKQPECEKTLRELTQGLNTFFFDGEMERYQSFSLYACCDSFVSLHRAEGLGLAIAEAMLLSKPVIATGYSGNMEFMNHTNSMPVQYKLVEIQEDQTVYRKGQWWAEPDIDDAAKCMTVLVADRALCADMGAKAKLHIETHFSAEKSGHSMRSRIDYLVKTRAKDLGILT
jgi:glycosyltransferase involved in cell wall biosynthesis